MSNYSYSVIYNFVSSSYNSSNSLNNYPWRFAKADGYYYLSQTEFRTDYLDETILWGESLLAMLKKGLKLPRREYYQLMRQLERLYFITTQNQKV